MARALDQILQSLSPARRARVEALAQRKLHATLAPKIAPRAAKPGAQRPTPRSK